MIQQVWSQQATLEAFFKQSLASNFDKALEQAGFWTTVDSVLSGLYPVLSAQAASGPPAARVGVVNAMIALSKQYKDHRAKCLASLLGYLNENDPKVTNAAARIIETEGFLSWPEAPSFLDQFLGSDAFLANPCALLFILAEFEGSLLPFSTAIEKAVAQISGPPTEEMGIPARQPWRASLDVSKVLLRLYVQAEEYDKNHPLRTRSLDMWDALLRTALLFHAVALSGLNYSLCNHEF